MKCLKFIDSQLRWLLIGYIYHNKCILSKFDLNRCMSDTGFLPVSALQNLVSLPTLYIRSFSCLRYSSHTKHGDVEPYWYALVKTVSIGYPTWHIIFHIYEKHRTPMAWGYWCRFLPCPFQHRCTVTTQVMIPLQFYSQLNAQYTRHITIRFGKLIPRLNPTLSFISLTVSFMEECVVMNHYATEPQNDVNSIR